MTTDTRKRRKVPPLWLYGGKPTDDFKRDGRCNCIGKRDYFFSDDLSDQAIATKLCAECPLLHPCTRWTLHNFELLPDGIFAGMTFDRRLRIYEGREKYWDWAKEFSYPAKAARAASRTRERKGVRKRDQLRIEVPLCKGCGSNQYVSRSGRNKTHNKQRYLCTWCGHYFLGEEL